MGMKYFPSLRHRIVRIIARFREKCSSFNRIRMLQTCGLLTRDFSPVNIISFFWIEVSWRALAPCRFKSGSSKWSIFAGIRAGRANYNRTTSFSINVKLQIFAKTLDMNRRQNCRSSLSSLFCKWTRELWEKWLFRRRSLILTRICSVTNLNWR